MKLIDEKYIKLRPSIECLADEVVISQAWKKTHAYMRRHNWYADTLALDVSAIALETNASIWASGLKKTELALFPMELVPAAKSERWVVDRKNGWGPSDRDKKNPPVRPLAHLTVRDQTWATAVMMCLADYVESAQGNCSTSDFQKAQVDGVSSYGNRLLCDWKAKKGWFRWGNGETYRKFFTDYQNFLLRPITLGRAVGEGTAAIDQVFVVSLDISRFYDCIDKKLLINKLKRIAEKNDDYVECPDFWRVAKKVLDWEWSKESVIRAREIGIKLGEGLPQGLVSAGFFANAYLIDFDKAMARVIGKEIPGDNSIVVHDYARYVDDLRLVVSVGDVEDLNGLIDTLSTYVDEKLQRYGGKENTLKTNAKKAKVVSIEDLDNTSSSSGRIAQLQNSLSGPADRDSLDSMSSLLEGLLTAQEDGMPSISPELPDFSLLEIAKFDGDVRADTLKRFAANRLETVMRLKRKVNFSEVTEHTGARGAIDNESELLAKKMIWAWMQDPSLASVLRKGFEIYPSPSLAEAVGDAIFKRCSFNPGTEVISGAIFDYLLADLFRFCVELHTRYERFDFPSGTDVEGFLALFGGYAQRAISESALPKFVARQALMLLAVLRTPVAGEAREDNSGIQYDLHDILSGRKITWQKQRLALFEVASQITGQPNAIASQFLEIALKQNKRSLNAVLEELAKRGGPLWNSVWFKLKKGQETKSLAQQFSWAAPSRSGPALAKSQILAKLSSSTDNGFVHEAAFLKLALQLLEISEQSLLRSISPKDIVVNWKGNGRPLDWAAMWHPDVEITCQILDASGVKDPRFESPSWLMKNDAAQSLYWIGAILRSAVVGSSDFTSARWKVRPSTGYKGLRTAWYKRRIGMIHSPEALVGEYATLSTWATELLMKCLQWPGFESTHLKFDSIRLIEDLPTFKAVVNQRLKVVNSLVCAASNVPSVITSVDRHNSRIGRQFRLVAVQQLLPRTRHFSVGDITLSNPKLRFASRDHLSRICEIVFKTLVTQSAAETNVPSSMADLIVFPEVAVHCDDLDILKRLADKSRSMIFAGLIFSEHEGKIVNTAQWIIPSYSESGRQWVVRNQGKENMTTIEKKLGVMPFRPCQHIIEVTGDEEGPFRLSGTICYDATDLKFVSDMADKTDLFVVASHNKDVTTFDTMASALHYHMYQHVMVVNKGEFGGSTIQAPYKERYDRLISHSHGVDQISINVADLDLAAFRRKSKKYKDVKDPPAGISH